MFICSFNFNFLKKARDKMPVTFGSNFFKKTNDRLFKVQIHMV